MGRWLMEALPEVASRVAAAASVILFADFDGTLAPFVELPQNAALLPGMRDVLRRLLERQRLVLAIISGRDVLDLEPRVGIAEAIYAGCHGLEIRGRGLAFLEPGAASRRRALHDLVTDLAARLQPIDGALVEDRGLTASVHYRRVAASRREVVQRIVDAVVAGAGNLFRVSPGEMVHEIRPAVNWNKGSAVSWIRKQLDLEDALAVCLGDDLTDEDAFAVLPDGITVRVREPAQTVARYFVHGPPEVQQFLEWLAGRIR